MSGEQTAESGGLKLPFPASLLSFLDRKPPGPRRTRRQPPDDGAAEEAATAAAAAAEEAGDQQQTPPQPPQFSQRPQRQRRKKRPAPSASESEGDEAGDEDDDDEASFAAVAPAPKRAPVSLPPLSSLPLMPSPQQQPATAATVATTTTAAPRRCKCKNSRCLKLYCECFRAGRHCGPDCECICCHNNPAHAAEVDRLRALALERNPAAFDPRDKKKKAHNGCKCKRSGCLKKYCECFQAGRLCGPQCKCQDCKNYEGSEALAAVLSGRAIQPQAQQQHQQQLQSPAQRPGSKRLRERSLSSVAKSAAALAAAAAEDEDDFEDEDDESGYDEETAAMTAAATREDEYRSDADVLTAIGGAPAARRSEDGAESGHSEREMLTPTRLMLPPPTAASPSVEATLAPCMPTYPLEPPSLVSSFALLADRSQSPQPHESAPTAADPAWLASSMTESALMGAEVLTTLARAPLSPAATVAPQDVRAHGYTPEKPKQ